AAVAADPERLRDTVARRCRRRGWEHWVDPVTEWLGRLLGAPLDLPGTGEPLRLSRLAACQPELEFWFETRWVDARRIDGAVRVATLDAAPRPEMETRILNGMLKGFIDLVFEHEGRYYTLDYKSNWLGPGAVDYTAARMRERVLESRYDLQYVLYTLALHRLLQVRLPGYKYERHLGGTITWFLRGLDSPGGGLHFERPPAALIEELDRMVRAAPDRAAEVLP
ncbi:MAG: exodeoxyribonuclease V subunit beta, partial [Thioalkalivibrio sp.]|nr:exodeoxyribonuclease V subunit beta [Thioalkalivibrio sp.]